MQPEFIDRIILIHFDGIFLGKESEFHSIGWYDELLAKGRPTPDRGHSLTNLFVGLHFT